jgi:ring-1,2-phenylacetyl-CoA epoxidase subunit PaaC
MTASIQIQRTPDVQYLLRLGDTCLILGQRLAEWCGHGPVLEEDIALTNMALDLVGQARAVLTHAGQLSAEKYDEDQLAFLRDERDFFNVTMVELPGGPKDSDHSDFAFTVLRNAMVATLLKLLWTRLIESKDTELAGIAGKAVKEARYHQQHAADWVVRLGDGTPESRRRMMAALEKLWRYSEEWFVVDAVDEHAHATGLGPLWADVRADWTAEMTAILEDATLTVPPASPFRSTGKNGVHSEHMGAILATMQTLQRSFPGGVW